MRTLRVAHFALLVWLILLPTCGTAENGRRSSRTSVEPRTPPMGWNSWDSYGTTINEDQVRSAAKWIAAHLKPYGWQYVVVDMEWFVTNPTPAGNSRSSEFSMDEYGRYTPAPNRFPSASDGAGFKLLARYVHSLGEKFGVHILRGIPKKAVENDLPIANSPFRAADAADRADQCPWNPDNYGIDASKPAGQAYYNSIAMLYSNWGVDFLKVDCIAGRPYKPDDIRMLSTALRNTGRPILLSLSPGPAPIDKVEELRQYAAMWRISDDVWDLWQSTGAFPQGVAEQFARAAQWAPLSQSGHWADADMLPIGYLGPAPGWGRPRQTRLTQDEQRTLLTLWCMLRSPLMWGGNPSESDPWTTTLLTNPEVLSVDQLSVSSRAVMQTDKIVAWLAEPTSGKAHYVAVFNLKPFAQAVRLAWSELGLREGRYEMRELWQHKNPPTAGALGIDLPPHGSVLYKITPRE